MNKFSLLVLFSIVLAAALTGWLKSITQTTGHQKQSAQTNKLEYYLRGFTMTDFNASGEPSLNVEGDYLHYKPETDITEILKPSVDYINDNKVKWHIQADRLLAKSEALDEFQLLGNVLAKRLPSKLQAAININADSMLFKPKAEYLEAFDLTQLESGHNIINATNGLTANLKSGIMTLSKAQGRYKADAH